jgi:cell division cycle protein 20 (cofactor of APC complex)
MVHLRTQVCGLAWSHDGLTLASGGNDNLLGLWYACVPTCWRACSHCTQGCAQHIAYAERAAAPTHSASGGGEGARLVSVAVAAPGIG